MVEMDLEKAVEKIKQGDESGFNELYTNTVQQVYFRAKQCTKTDADAQDITQIVYVEAFRNIDKLNNPKAILGWLYEITYRQACKLYRGEREKREVLLSEDSEGLFDIEETTDVSSMPELSADQKATAEIIRDIIEELPDLQKTAVIAYYFDEMKVEQIADVMDCSVNTVKSRLNYARKYIKDKVEEHEKKCGYRLHAIGVPTFILAIKMLMNQNSVSTATVQSIYNGCCISVGLDASTIALSATSASSIAVDAVSAGSITTIGTATSSVAATGSAVTGGIATATKALIIVAAVTVTGGGVATVAHNTNQSVQHEEQQEVPIHINEIEPVEDISENTYIALDINDFVFDEENDEYAVREAQLEEMQAKRAAEKAAEEARIAEEKRKARIAKQKAEEEAARQAAIEAARLAEIEAARQAELEISYSESDEDEDNYYEENTSEQEFYSDVSNTEPSNTEPPYTEPSNTEPPTSDSDDQSGDKEHMSPTTG